MEHTFQSRVFPPEEANQKLERFRKVVEALAQAEQLHGLLMVASLSVPPSGESAEPDVNATCFIGGCHIHNVSVLARYLTDALTDELLAYFLAMMMRLQAQKRGIPEPVLDDPAQATENNLLEMPLPAGKKWMH